MRMHFTSVPSPANATRDAFTPNTVPAIATAAPNGFLRERFALLRALTGEGRQSSGQGTAADAIEPIDATEFDASAAPGD